MATGHYLRPNWVINRIIHPLLIRAGLKPTLAVRGRTSGRWRTVPVNILEYEGQAYLVAPRGSTEWSRNLRAAGEGELRQGRSVRRFRAVEVPDADKPPLIEAYRRRWSGEAGRFFAELPDPADHPVFRLTFV